MTTLSAKSCRCCGQPLKTVRLRCTAETPANSYRSQPAQCSKPVVPGTGFFCASHIKLHRAGGVTLWRR
jgi:hypothetical protein